MRFRRKTALSVMAFNAMIACLPGLGCMSRQSEPNRLYDSSAASEGLESDGHSEDAYAGGIGGGRFVPFAGGGGQASARRSGGYASSSDSEEYPVQSAAVIQHASWESDASSDQPHATAKGNQPADVRRIVVYTANYLIVVPEIEAAMARMKSIAEAAGGWVDQVDRNTMKIRVPASRFEDTTSLIESLGRFVERSLKAADVTEDYVDLEARLRNARAVRDRLNALLAKAEDVKAALEVEKELARVGREIERLEAKFEILRNRVAFSTISVGFQTVARTAPAPINTQLPFAWLRELNPRRLTSTY